MFEEIVTLRIFDFRWLWLQVQGSGSSFKWYGEEENNEARRIWLILEV